MVAVCDEIIIPNSKQQECIDIMDGKLMVLAGPGTGKTFTLINRIKNMITKGILPESILCLTFSDAAASEMKARLVKDLGAIASGVAVYTYHSFCLEIIRLYPEQFELMEKFKLINNSSQRNLMKETLESCDIIHYRSKLGELYYCINEILGNISELKKKQISKDFFFQCIENNPNYQAGIKIAEMTIKEYIEKGKNPRKGDYDTIDSCKKRIEKAKELWRIYETYQEKMLKNNFIDFDDMINFVLKAFEGDIKFLQEVAEDYKYFLVDEYQDTNVQQNRIIFNLLNGSSEKNIFLVGDDDQIIYGFQGAQRDNLEKFLTQYPETKVICLQENNRSTQSILDLSYQIISQDKNRIECNSEFSKYNISKKLNAMNDDVMKKDKKVRLNIFGDSLQEYNYIIEDIEKTIQLPDFPLNKNGEKNLSEMAILTKENSSLNIYAELLKSKNIPFQLTSGKNIFTIKSSIITYFYLKALENNILYGDKLFGLLLSSPFEIAIEDYNLLLKKWHFNHNDFITNMRKILSSNIVEFKNPDKINEFLHSYDKLKKYKSATNLRDTVIGVLNETKILEYFMNCDVNRTENILGIKKIIDEASSLMELNPTVSLNDFVNHLDTALNEEIPILTDKNSYVQNAVQLLTYHGSKGREFEYVYLPNLTKNQWEGERGRAKKNLPTDECREKDEKKLSKMAEQLKLLFVGITRAKHTLTLSFANQIGSVPQQLTQYISQIDNSKFQTQIFEFNQDENLNQIAKSLTCKEFDYEKEFVNTIKLSPSSLNTFLNCPRNFFYSKILKIDVLDIDWDSANYGTTIHKTLEQSVLTAQKNNNIYPSIEEILDIFNSLLATQALSGENKRDELKKRGNENLKNYYPKFIETSVQSIKALEYVFDNVELCGGVLNGKIDRIEHFADGTYGLYDYKTGSAKSKSQIADGKAYESYLNQLRFYKYVYEKLHDVKVSQVGLIYPEDFTHNYQITLTDNDNKIIENKISQTFEAIRNLKFETTPQTNEKCKFCSYKTLCTLEVV